MIRIKRGLDIPIAGQPDQTIHDGPLVRTVGLVSPDYLGMKPSMAVAEGDRVQLGQVLFTDRKTPGVQFTSPGAGRVAAITRGAKRVFHSMTIELDGDEEVTFPAYREPQLPGLTRDEVRESLVASGLWTALRTRPFGLIPNPVAMPHSIFVTAIDTNPLAARPEVVIKGREAEFANGLQVLRHLTNGELYVCKAEGAEILASPPEKTTVAEFHGPHPAGLPGTHIHFLDPVGRNKTVWHIGYQDVIAVGYLFTTGRLLTERVISLAGPVVKQPRLLRARLGASITELVDDELEDGSNRVVSGSVLSGRAALPPHDYLGRYHTQISALHEGRERHFLGWARAGMHKFSVKRVFASGFVGSNRRPMAMTTSKEGSNRAMVPIGMYEQVMPLDILPTPLLKMLIIGDLEQCQLLGGLELDEEDLALCTFVCPGKYEYGPLLRKALNLIEREG